MICDFCQGPTIARRVKKHHWHKNRPFVLENVTAEVCRECGERYYQATTLDAIDRLLEGDYPIKEKLQVEVFEMHEAVS